MLPFFEFRKKALSGSEPNLLHIGSEPNHFEGGSKTLITHIIYILASRLFSKYEKRRALAQSQFVFVGGSEPSTTIGTYSTVTDFARLRGLSTSLPRSTAA